MLGRDTAADEERLVEAEPITASTMYLGINGTGTLMRRRECEGRPGKGDDGQARTREGKLLVTWTVDGFDDDGRPCCDPGSVTYSAAIETAA